MGGHLFLEYMSFRMICLMRAIVLSEVMCDSRICVMGGHALMECMSSVWYILQYVVLYLKTCLTGGYVLLEGKYYRMAYLAVQNVLLEYMFCRRSHFTELFVLQEDTFH